MVKLGVIITAATVTILVAEFFRLRRHSFAAHGWLGLLALACPEYLMFHGIETGATYFTPMAWNSCILIVDARARLPGISSLCARMLRDVRERGMAPEP
jgi:hypothetical protein